MVGTRSWWCARAVPRGVAAVVTTVVATVPGGVATVGGTCRKHGGYCSHVLIVQSGRRCISGSSRFCNFWKVWGGHVARLGGGCGHLREEGVRVDTCRSSCGASRVPNALGLLAEGRQHQVVV